MTVLGYFLSSEEHGPSALLDQARLAEEHGMDRVWISDHFHPWLDDQGESPFVWTVIGAIGATTSLSVTTAVTCPTTRIHPAIVAHAAATAALTCKGGFRLGVGTGEFLNEHVLGDPWPRTDIRLEQLEEAVEVMRALWTGEVVHHRGRHYEVDWARLYTVPSEPVEVPMSAFGAKATELAARIADGFMTTSPDADGLRSYRQQGGKGPAMAGQKVCWAADDDTAREQVHRLWRSSGLPGELGQELKTPAHFEQGAELVTVDQMAEKYPHGPDPEVYVERLRAYEDAGFDEVYLQQIGEDTAGFFDFFRKEIEPRL